MDTNLREEGRRIRLRFNLDDRENPERSSGQSLTGLALGSAAPSFILAIGVSGERPKQN